MKEINREMKTKTWVELIIDEFPFTPDEMSSRLGLKPSASERKGDIKVLPRGKSLIEPFNTWKLESGCDSKTTLQDQIKELLNKMRPYKEKFIPVCREFPPDVNVVIHMYSSEVSPYIGWDNNVMKELADYNASWGIDLSVYGEDDE